MQFYLLLLFLPICLLSCSEPRLYTIEGTTSDNRMEGEWLYCIPLTGETKKSVDSAQVINGQFRLEGVADTIGLRILRPRAILRLFVQELLIVVEPGTVRVQLDSISSAEGSPLNEQLQQWKEKKQQQDEAMRFIRQSLKDSHPVDSLTVEEYNNGLQTSWKEYNYNFVKKNINNPIGMFVYNLVGGIFTPEQKQGLAIPGD